MKTVFLGGHELEAIWNHFETNMNCKNHVCYVCFRSEKPIETGS